MADPTITPFAVMVAERVDCKACNGTGYEPGHAPTTPGVPYRWCATCQGQQTRLRAMPLADFAKLFTYGETITWSGNVIGQRGSANYDICVRESPPSGDTKKGSR